MSEDRDLVAAFRTSAERYLSVIDAVDDTPPDKLFDELARVLPALYAAANRLPHGEVSTDEVPDTAQSRHESWKALVHRLDAALAADDLCWTVVPFGQRDATSYAVAWPMISPTSIST